MFFTRSLSYSPCGTGWHTPPKRTILHTCTFMYTKLQKSPLLRNIKTITVDSRYYEIRGTPWKCSLNPKFALGGTQCSAWPSTKCSGIAWICPGDVHVHCICEGLATRSYKCPSWLIAVVMLWSQGLVYHCTWWHFLAFPHKRTTVPCLLLSFPQKSEVIVKNIGQANY